MSTKITMTSFNRASHMFIINDFVYQFQTTKLDKQLLVCP